MDGQEDKRRIPFLAMWRTSSRLFSTVNGYTFQDGASATQDGLHTQGNYATPLLLRYDTSLLSSFALLIVEVREKDVDYQSACHFFTF